NIAGMARFGINPKGTLGVPMPKLKNGEIAREGASVGCRIVGFWYTRSPHPRIPGGCAVQGHGKTDGELGLRFRFLGRLRPGVHEPFLGNSIRMEESEGMDGEEGRIREARRIRTDRGPSGP